MTSSFGGPTIAGTTPSDGGRKQGGEGGIEEAKSGRHTKKETD